MLDVSHQQMEQYRAQPAHAEKIAYQQKLLQEDVVHIRAEISQASTVRREARDSGWVESSVPNTGEPGGGPTLSRLIHETPESLKAKFKG